MFEEIFARKRLSPPKLLACGFICTDNTYCYTCPILDDEFLLHITFDRHGNPDTSLTECDTGEPYTLYRTTAQGRFVGDVREAIATVLRRVADECFESSAFRQTQTMELLAYASEIYSDCPEFLWEKTPQNAILRRKDSGKWYAAILTIPKSKLGLESDTPVEIINLHDKPDLVAEKLGRAEVFPAWHMNKKSWYTVILDGSIDNTELFSWLDKSYRLAGRH